MGSCFFVSRRECEKYENEGMDEWGLLFNCKALIKFPFLVSNKPMRSLFGTWSVRIAGGGTWNLLEGETKSFIKPIIKKIISFMNIL